MKLFSSFHRNVPLLILARDGYDALKVGALVTKQQADSILELTNIQKHPAANHLLSVMQKEKVSGVMPFFDKPLEAAKAMFAAELGNLGGLAAIIAIMSDGRTIIALPWDVIDQEPTLDEEKRKQHANLN